MTNLLAILAVAIVTNVTKTSNESGCQSCSAFPGSTPAVYYYGGNPKPCAPYKEATERTETTEVREIRTLTFTWEGEQYTAKRGRVLASSVRRWVRKEEWEESTNTVTFPSGSNVVTDGHVVNLDDLTVLDEVQYYNPYDGKDGGK